MLIAPPLKSCPPVKSTSIFLLLVAALAAPPRSLADPDPPLPAKSAADLIRWLLADEGRLRDIPFPDVIAATTGHKVLPLEDSDPVAGEITAHVRKAAQAVLEAMNGPESPVRGLRRINEASRHFEEALVAQMNKDGFECHFPKTAAGEEQRSGYPDIELRHRKSGRIAYIDPKLFEESSRQSTLRTFYFEPRGQTNKVNADAHHILVGFSHDGKDGAWKYLTFELVDLHALKVQLKAEFHASNKDIYRKAPAGGKTRGAPKSR
jgi:hypothetical protein